MLELDVVPQVREEGREVGPRARVDPGFLPHRGGAREVGGEVAGDPARLLPATLDYRDQARFVRVGGRTVQLRLGGVEQPPGLGRDEALVEDALDGPDLVSAQPRATRRHHRLLIPLQELRSVAQVRQLRQTPAQLGLGPCHS